MPYLPSTAGSSPPTLFPYQTGKDLDVQIRLIAEKWRRMFPLIPYRRINSQVTTVTNLLTPVGAAGGTIFDPLYNEPLPTSTTDLTVDQPPSPAANPKVFHDPINVNVNVRRQPERKEMNFYGFNELRDGIAIIPLSLLDDAQIVIANGDQFLSGGVEWFEVLQWRITGFWKNSYSRLFMAMSIQSVTRGE